MIKERNLFILALLICISFLMTSCSTGYLPDEFIETEIIETENFTEDDIKKIAVENRDLTKDEVEFTDIDFIEDDLHKAYRVCFNYKGEFHEVDIDNMTGRIIDYFKE